MIRPSDALRLFHINWVLLRHGLDEVVLHALDKDKTTRFQSAGDFYEALVPFLLEGARGRFVARDPKTARPGPTPAASLAREECPAR